MPLHWLNFYLVPILISVLLSFDLTSFAECEDTFDSPNRELSPLDLAKTSGFFVPAPLERLDHIMGSFLDWNNKKTNNPSEILLQMFPGMQEVQRVQLQDSVSFEDVFPPVKGASYKEDISELALSLIAENAKANSNLNEFGYKGVASFAVIQGFAGLWSRGGGEVVKGLVPVNLAELIGEPQAQVLVEYGKILADKTMADSDPRKVEAKEIVHKIIYHAAEDSRAKPPVLLKLLQIANLSYRAKSYIPLDFWTSKHTHSSLQKYLRNLRQHPERFVFHSDPKQDSFLKNILKSYLDATVYLGQTSVIGVQSEVPLIKRINVGGFDQYEYSYDYPSVGEGAGMHAPYYEFLGRREEFLSLGVTDVVFQNIEVFSPLEEEFALHWQKGNPVSLTSVPIQNGYSGGAPYKIIFKDGSHRFVMLEDSNVPEELKVGNVLFNANTIFLGIKSPWAPKYLAFEPASGVGYRVKVNAGDVTLDLPTTLIRGEIPRHYVNFKKYEEYLLHGVQLVDDFILSRMKPVD